MKKLVLYNIHWDATEDEQIEFDLPTHVAIDLETTNKRDYLSDRYGFLVESFESREVDILPERKCSNCKFRAFSSWSGVDYCLGYEMTLTDEEEMVEAAMCSEYEKGTPECFDEEERYTSSTNGDYSPGNPWDAPGMSVRDFI